jgi:succinate-semialdehyde dehydrogenase/glutarate-semialdehyde dehydrogenase
MRTFDVIDKATDQRIASVPDMDEAAVTDAIAAAAHAFPAWRDRPAIERSTVLARMADLMKDREPQLAALITAENGKPLAEAAAEVQYAASFLRWFAGEAVRVYGETIPAPRADQRIVVTREPVGVCALITPWNFPAAMIARKLGPALAVGCTVVCKPASQTPLTTLRLAELAREAGAPEGVVTVVTGNAGRIGGVLLGDRRVRKVSFTGSTPVGMQLMKQAADDLKRLSLELGGNAPFVVFDDADVEKMTAGAMIAKYRCGGQTCVAANRFVVQRGVHDAAARSLVEASAALKVAPGTEEGAKIGPMIDDKGVAKVRELVTDALSKGAEKLLGDVPDGSTRLVKPIVLTGITEHMAIWKEEIFGPVIAIRACADEADAIAQANDTEMGLVAYVWTRDLARAERVVRALEVGMVGVNEGLVSYAHAPFGGVKHSGLGREGGRAGLDDYVNLKYVMTSVSP